MRSKGENFGNTLKRNRSHDLIGQYLHVLALNTIIITELSDPLFDSKNYKRSDFSQIG